MESLGCTDHVVGVGVFCSPKRTAVFEKQIVRFFVEFCGDCDEDVSIMVGSPTKPFFFGELNSPGDSR